MSLTHIRTAASEGAAYGGFVDAAGGIATVALTIVGLSHTAPELMLSIATIVFGAALLIQGGAMLSEYAQLISFPEAGATGAVGTSAATASSGEFAGGSLAALFLAGGAGIILGILSVVGIDAPALTSCAIVAFGAAMLLGANAVWHLQHTKRAVSAGQQTTTEVLANEIAYGSASVQALSGVAAIVLGIIALSGGNSTILSLVALLELGATLIVSGTSLSATVMGFMRPEPTVGVSLSIRTSGDFSGEERGIWLPARSTGEVLKISAKWWRLYCDRSHSSKEQVIFTRLY